MSLLLKIADKVPSSLVTRLGGLKANLAKVSKVSFDVYVGLLALTVMIVSAGTFVVSAVVLSFMLQSLVQVIGCAFLLAVVADLIAVGIFYLTSVTMILSRARKIDANLPLVANFMAVLANSGMPPERILRSLGNVGDEFGVGDEVRRAVGDVELMGLDFKGALRNAATRSSSSKFASLLNGVITTSHMGGDLDAYLREKANVYKKARRLSMKSFLENLNSVAEVYVSFMVALPLALIIMLSVMSFIGSDVSIFGTLDPYILLMLITFLVTPAGVAVLLLLVDSLTPPR